LSEAKAKDDRRDLFGGGEWKLVLVKRLWLVYAVF